MKTKFSKNQKLILTVFTVLILAVKLFAFHHQLNFYSPDKLALGISAAIYYLLMLGLMIYLGYIGKGFKAMTIIFAVLLLLILLLFVFIGPIDAVQSSGTIEFILSLIATILMGVYLFTVGTHLPLYSSIPNFNWWKFVLALASVYVVFLAVGFISKKLFQKYKR